MQQRMLTMALEPKGICFFAGKTTRERQRNFSMLCLCHTFVTTALIEFIWHDTGNELIVAAAQSIADTFKRNPVFRIGGDEFLAIIQNRGFQDRETLVASWRECCDEKIISAGEQRIRVSIACGSTI